MTNPILAFSAKRRMRSVRTPALLSLYAAALTVMAYLVVYQPFMAKSITVSTMRASVNGYGYLIIAQFALLVMVAPAMTAGSLSGERERQTLDLLLVTNTSPWQIVFGKLMESFAFLALLVLCSTPVLSLVLLTGGATVGQVMQSVLFLLLVALAGSSVGLFCSAFCKRTAASTVAAYLMMLAIGVVTLIPLWYDLHQIDLIYQEMTQNGQMITAINYPAIAFSANPALGLFSLLHTQTGMFESVMWSFSYTLANTMAYLPFDRYLTANMLFMAVASALLCVLAGLKVQLSKTPRRKGNKKA